MNFCPVGGKLVSGEGRVPQDPSEHCPARIIIGHGIGCNRLRCGGCGERVRQHIGLMATRNDPETARTLFEAEDWSGHPLVEANTWMRLYACRCRVWNANGHRALIDHDPDPFEASTPPWRCEGHPAARLPLDVDGVHIDVDTDLDALVRRVFGGWMPPGSPVVDMYENWVARLYERLAGLPLAEAVSRAVARRIAETDPVQVGSALIFFGRYPRAPGFAAVLDLVETPFSDTSYPARIAARLRMKPVAEVMAARLQEAQDPLDLDDLRAREALRRLLLDPMAETSLQLWKRIFELDPVWLAEHIVQVARVHPDQWSSLLLSLGLKDAALGVIAGTALMQSDVVEPAVFEHWLQRHRVHPWTHVVRQSQGG